jgi:hypothetical protein
LLGRNDGHFDGNVVRRGQMSFLTTSTYFLFFFQGILNVPGIAGYE